MSSNTSRESILNALRRGKDREISTTTISSPWTAPALSKKEAVERFCMCLEKAFADVVRTSEKELGNTLQGIMQKFEITTLASGSDFWFKDTLNSVTNVQHIPFSEDITSFKEELFTVDAGITSTKGGIAENGAVLLWTSKEEPRTLSLVPPIHIAIVKASSVYSSLLDAITELQWDSALPTNLVLVSSPSRTADIELVLAMGVHGPKKLVVVLVE